MKLIRTIIYILLSMNLLSGCMTYQYVNLVSVEKEDSVKNITSQTDSLEFSYEFSGNGGFVSIQISNHSERPLLLDKAKSSVIHDDYSTPFWSGQSEINTESTTTRSIWVDSESSGTTTGTLSSEPEMLFIPPHSKAILSGPQIEQEFFALPPKQQLTKIPLGLSYGYMCTYEGQESPGYYRIFLTLVYHDSPDQPFYIDKTYRIADITRTSVPPQDFPSTTQQQFHIKKMTGGGKIMATAGLLGLFTVAILAESETEQ
ncbi:hypothetical protein ACT3CD_07885 [Geofilum sp. OHC36d9]|uniref:hypothetical protein n=1 Tax=Geofilum sp. OHC36d9 TaxID=3458413 RepID=UPI004034E093